MYTASLVAVALGRARGFVITPKGNAQTRDSLVTFRKHLLWGLIFGVPLALSLVLGHDHTSMRAWSAASLVVCVLPLAIWRVQCFRRRGRAEPALRAVEPAHAHARTPELVRDAA